MTLSDQVSTRQEAAVSRAEIIAGTICIWAFYLLIADEALVLLGTKFGLPVKPTVIYAAVSLGLVISALAISRSARPLLEVKGFLLPLFGLVILAIVLYRSELIGPDFGGMLLSPQFIPSSISYAIWPALNLLACAGLYLLARQQDLRRIIIVAAFVTLALQTVCMEADMWWYALFGDPNGRAGGLAQNANVASLLVVTLASIALAERSIAGFAVALAVFAVLLSQSKTGGIAVLVLCACFWWDRRRQPVSRSLLAFAGGLTAVLVATIVLSPVLNPTDEQLAAREQMRAKMQAVQNTFVSNLDLPVTLEERLKARTSLDESAGLRSAAYKFYGGILLDHPSVLLGGLGTGFTNRFVTGPHNTFLKLTVDNGVVAPFLLLLSLAFVTRLAVQSRSMALVSLCATAWIGAMLYHTLVVDPIVLPALGATLGINAALLRDLEGATVQICR